jgi:hypothetical protein
VAFFILILQMCVHFHCSFSIYHTMNVSPCAYFQNLRLFFWWIKIISDKMCFGHFNVCFKQIPLSSHFQFYQFSLFSLKVSPCESRFMCVLLRFFSFIHWIRINSDKLMCFWHFQEISLGIFSILLYLNLPISPFFLNFVNWE